jgi:aspartate racemase
MEQPFYRVGLEKAGIGVTVPSPKDRGYIHNVIFNELSVGIVSRDAKMRITKIVNELSSGNGKSILLACTELSLLISAADCKGIVADTSTIHAAALLEQASAGAGDALRD